MGLPILGPIVPPRVPVGIGPPNVLTIQVNSPLGGPDLTTVSAASIAVTRVADGSQAIWAATIAGGAVQGLLTLTHVFAASDCPSPGPYELVVSLTVAGGTIPCYVCELEVELPANSMPPYTETAPSLVAVTIVVA